ncbi:MAG TPA: hypothetical protein VKV27_13775 [Solirubrobacteraceae bacterium]|nr:hypothetical protein [Solirubrobacteraceae bacterium]
MAHTKRKRTTKHRGNAAGVVEARGRTSRPPSPKERKQRERTSRGERRRLSPPTWKGAVKKALLAAGFMFVFLLVTNRFRVVPALVFAAFALALYTPAGYYMDGWLYRRQQRKEAQAGRAGAR